jgi:uncharacterized tellurite resistance protein B-like protein
MLKHLKNLFEAPAPRAVPGFERRQLQVAVAALLHEASRADYHQGDDEYAVAERALGEMFALDAAQCAGLLEEGRARAEQLSSFYAPVSVIKRDFSLEERVRLVEWLWRVAFANGQLNPYEDHYVRKIAHLLYVPNTQSMLARNRARSPTTSS